MRCLHTDLKYFWSLDFSRKGANAKTVKYRLEVIEYEKNKRKIKAHSYRVHHVVGILLCVFPTIIFCPIVPWEQLKCLGK